MTDDVKGDLMQRSREWLQSCVNAATRSGVPEEADLEAFILAHLDGEEARQDAAVAAAREEQREACWDVVSDNHDEPYSKTLRALAAMPLTSTPLADRIAELEAFGRRVSAIRDSIVGSQQFNWSEHAYPLVAALDAAGFNGAGYKIASANFGTLLDRLEKAEAERDAERGLYRSSMAIASRNLEAMEAERDALRAQVAEAAERLDEFGSQPTLADGIQAMRLRLVELRAQVEAARSFVARNTEPVEDDDSWSAGYADALDDLLTAMDGAKP